MKFKTRFEGIIYKELKGELEDLKKKYDILNYDHDKKSGVILTYYPLPRELDEFSKEAQKQGKYILRVNGHKKIGFNDLKSLEKYAFDNNEYSWQIPDEHLAMGTKIGITSLTSKNSDCELCDGENKKVIDTTISQD